VLGDLNELCAPLLRRNVGLVHSLQSGLHLTVFEFERRRQSINFSLLERRVVGVLLDEFSQNLVRHANRNFLARRTP
jgi:hypothetical protein